jgi:hypothetical protein
MYLSPDSGVSPWCSYIHMGGNTTSRPCLGATRLPRTGKTVSPPFSTVLRYQRKATMRTAVL